MKIPVVVIIIDALGSELCRRHRFHPEGLDRELRLETVLGFSQAALTTIMTGAAPDEHGLWMMYSFAGKRSPFAWLSRLPAAATTERLFVRRMLNWKLRHIDRVTSYYNLYDVPAEIIVKLDIPARKQLFEPGSVASKKNLLDMVISGGGGYFARDYRTPEKSAFDQLAAALDRGEKDFYLLYTAGLDSTMHEHGVSHARTAAHLEWYSSRIMELLEKGPEMRLIVLGDHGMCDVDRTLDLHSEVVKSGLELYRDYIPFYDSTMGRFRMGSDSAAGSMREHLGSISGGKVLSEKEMKRLGVYFGDGRFGDLIYIVDPGTIILPSYMGKNPVAAMHGYHPETPEMYSALFTNCSSEGDDPSSIAELVPFILPEFFKQAGSK